MADLDEDETRATAQLPTLDIEIVHRPHAANAAERLVVTVREVAPEEAFGRWLEAINPVLFWLRMSQAVWSVWLPGVVIPAPVKDIRQK
jgi:hypothetical protein